MTRTLDRLVMAIAGTVVLRSALLAFDHLQALFSDFCLLASAETHGAVPGPAFH